MINLHLSLTGTLWFQKLNDQYEGLKFCYNQLAWEPSGQKLNDRTVISTLAPGDS